MEETAKNARQASLILNCASTEKKDRALNLIQSKLSEQKQAIQDANKQDKLDAEKAVKSGAMTSSLSTRLDCSGSKFDSVLRGVSDVIQLTDPVGTCTLATKISDRMHLYRVTVPIGVLAVIFEARPEVVVQITALAIKSGNAVILKGGKEAKRTNQAIYVAIRSALREAEGIPEAAVQLVETREEVDDLLKLDRYIDLIIPRGSQQLVRHIKANTSIPVMGHADGLCAVYVDKEADMDMAAAIVDDSKTNYCAGCNAMETLLVHKDVASAFLPQLAARLVAKKVTYHADARALDHLPAEHSVAAKPEDYDTEFLTHDMAVRVVDDLETAIGHINEHGSHHTDVIVTKDRTTAELFLSRVDSAGVYHNCSSRFADGNRYGFGAEVGISTNRIHARGPVGLEGLVIHKYRMYGDGHTIESFSKTKETTMSSESKSPRKKQVPAEFEYIHQPIPLTSVPDVKRIVMRHSGQGETGSNFL